MLEPTTDFQKLAHPIIKLFSLETEITEIYTFGSSASNKLDEYSDIDMTLVSSNPSQTSRNLVNIITRVKSIRY